MPHTGFMETEDQLKREIDGMLDALKALAGPLPLCCERCGTPLGSDGGRYFPGSGYPLKIKREYAHICVPCETQLKYGPVEERDRA